MNSHLTLETLTIGAAVTSLRQGELSSECLTGTVFERIADPSGQGSHTFTSIMEASARSAAVETDRLLAAGLSPSPLAGIPVSIKDLFDVSGEVTRCGSIVLADQPPALQDAAAVSRLRRAGMVIVGRTNMTEFAYSGLGINPHFGTPLNPYDRDARRIPGGSSSGAAVSVSDGMCMGAIGSDTGGSLRIPAALCGLVGFKPTQNRVSLDGAFPLSPTLDTIGPIARTVQCCAALDAIIARDPASDTLEPSLDMLSLGVLRDFVLDDTQPYVAETFEHALSALSAAGVGITDIDGTKFLYELPEINVNGGIVAAEAYHGLQQHIDRKADDFDPRILSRIRNGEKQSARDYLNLLSERKRIIELFDGVTWQFDAVICPTVPWVAPRLDELDDDSMYFSTNALMLRNPSIANYVDRPAISLPCHAQGDAPVGLMLVGKRGADRFLLKISETIEKIMSRG